MLIHLTIFDRGTILKKVGAFFWLVVDRLKVSSVWLIIKSVFELGFIASVYAMGI